MKHNSMFIKNYKKILIANRGEIAIRIIKTAKKLGLKTVAVYSDEDVDSPHLKLADEKINIGKGLASESYLSIKNIINAAKSTESDAIHPGYGFLSENANFAKKCHKEKLIFIGPDPNVIQKMGDKKVAKSIAIKAGVPSLIDHYILPNEKMAKTIHNANKIGYPIMLKATKGGGGKGMRLVLNQKDLKSSLNLAKSESVSAFGSDEIIIEKALIKPRHIEVQIFGDNFGNFIHLGERDCSVQRRHQKIIEEAPAKGISKKIRNQLGEMAINLAKDINYKGAGTVEFLMDQDQNFFFLEMNTRLQVEHPVTEMITGLDLVELQFLIADGQQLTINQENINFKGHSIEVRLYAEDPLNKFFPSFGKIQEFNFSSTKHIRVDSGIEKNQIISSFYDPMVAKIISYSKTRSDSIDHLSTFLSNLSLIGVKNNRDFLINIISHNKFRKGEVNTSFIQEIYPKGIILETPTIIDFVAFAYLIYKDEFNSNLIKTSGIPKELQYWSNIDNLKKTFKISCLGKVKDIKIKFRNLNFFEIELEDKNYQLNLEEKSIFINKAYYNYNRLYKINDTYYLIKDKVVFEFFKQIETSDIISSQSSGKICSPMHGIISQINVLKNDQVSKGDSLLILEAMKMQHEISADIDGIIENIDVDEGSQVSSGDLLLSISSKQ
ncbi:MAG: acetyl/propionyl/methylcrotonyl-CoA carboxylase subunit alpha [Paracoccaceae bacterium]